MLPHNRRSGYVAVSIPTFETTRQTGRKTPVPANLPDIIKRFEEDDEGFFLWLDEHQTGYFVNSERIPKSTYLVLHRSGCSHIDRSPSYRWTKDYIKFCSASRSALEEWAASEVGGSVTLCRTCFG